MGDALGLVDAGSALLVGTVAGVFASWLLPARGDTHDDDAMTAFSPRASSWVRVGSCAQLPLVLAAGLSYQAPSDTVTVATMGRGVYILPNASQAVLAALRA